MIVDALVEIPKGSRNKFEYKTLEEKATEIVGWSGAAAAEQTVREAQIRFAAHHG